MTAKQITELHDLCLQINLLAVNKDNAPIVLYTLIGNSMYPQAPSSTPSAPPLRFH